MAIEAYKIFVEIATEAPLAPLNDLLRTMERVDKAQQNIQTGLNEMAAGLRGNTRLTNSLAAAMRSVASAAKEAAAATRGIRVGGGSGDGSASSGPRVAGTTYSDPTRTVSAAATTQLLLTGPRAFPALPYLPGSNQVDYTGVAPWNGLPTGFTLNGPARGPGSALVPAGPRMDRTDVTGRSPDRGVLIPVSGGGGAGGGSGGAYVPPRDEPFNNRPVLNPNPPKGGGFSPMHAVAATATAALVGDVILNTAKTVLAPAFQISQEATQIGAQTRQSSQAVQAIVRAAFDQQRQVRGTNVVGNLEAFRMLFSLTQNQDETEALLPSFLKSGVALQAFNPNQSYDQQLEGVFKSAEFMGAVSKTDPKTGKSSVDATGAQRVANMLLAFETVSNGAVDPNKFLAFLRSGGTAAANMDQAQISYLLPVIQSLNPRGAGQGLKSFEQQFSSGKMSQGVLEMLTEMSIVKNPALVRKIGIGQFMLKPGALDEQVMMQAITNPVDFYNDTLLPNVDKYLTKEYGTKFTGADVKNRHILESQVLQQLSSRIPGGTLLGELLRTAPLSARDAEAVKKSQAFDLAGTLTNSPVTQIAAFTGALNSLLAVFGAPALKGALTGINGLTAAMNALTQAGQDHPALAQNVSTVAGQGAELASARLAAWAAKQIANKAGKTGLAARIGMGASSATSLVELLIAKEAGGMLTDAALSTSVGNQAINAAASGIRAVDRFLGLQDFDRWFYKNIASHYDGGSAAPRGSASNPIATRSNPLPVVVTNGKDLLQSVDTHHAQSMMRPPASMTGANFGAAPAWAGVPGFAP